MVSVTQLKRRWFEVMAYFWSFGVNYGGSCSSLCCNYDSKTRRVENHALRCILFWWQINPATPAIPTSSNIFLSYMTYAYLISAPTIPSRTHWYLAISFHLRRLGVMLAARVPRLLAALKSATREEYWVSCSDSKRSFENGTGIHTLHAFINYHSSHSHTVIILLNLVWLPIYLWWFSPTNVD